MCGPSIQSRHLDMGHEMMSQIAIKIRTGMAKRAPMANPCFEQMACGMISENMTSNAVDAMTDINPGKYIFHPKLINYRHA